jgi:diguanylate cyclase (GGDEF)-like protein
VGRRAGRRPATLHRTWAATVTKLLALVAVLGVLALAAAQVEQVTYERTAGRIEAETTVVVTLDRALLQVVDPATTLLYAATAGDDAGAGAASAAYQTARYRLYQSFDRAAEVVRDATAAELLAEARASWRDMDDVVASAGELASDPQVRADLDAGRDPFRDSVWGRFNTARQQLSDLSQWGVDAMRQRTHAARGVQRLVAVGVVGSVVLSVVLSWLATRRLARQVVRPLAGLGPAAKALRDSEHASDVVVPGAVQELQELADAINDTAAALRVSHRRLRQQATTDALTGLPNRKAFTEHVEALLAPGGSGRVAVLFVDLDDFKEVNDTLGHEAGDELLQEVAARLRAGVREEGMVARLGGDEFAIVLDGADGAAAAAVAERLLAASAHVAVAGQRVGAGCSIGIATSRPASPVGPEELVRNADFAMYTAKGQGKGRYEVFAPSMHAEMVARTSLRAGLATACRDGELRLHHQPVVDLATGRVVGFEALLRWQHPTRGLLQPTDFVALAEETGDIVAIGAWVVRQACADLAGLHAATGAHDTWMSVNVSAVQLDHPFVPLVHEALRANGIAPRCLVVEVTEAVAVTTTGAGAAVLGELRRAGLHVALDDFGTGFSSLRYLHELPVDVLKIDRSFVGGTDAKSHAMLAGIVQLGRTLELRLVAEGIEEPGELARLRRLGAPLGQGNLFSPPVPAGEAAALLRRASLLPSAAAEPVAAARRPHA